MFHFKKLLSVDFCRENFVLFIGIAEIIDIQISVLSDFLIDCPTLKLDPFLLALSYGNKLIHLILMRMALSGAKPIL